MYAAVAAFGSKGTAAAREPAGVVAGAATGVAAGVAAVAGGATGTAALFGVCECRHGDRRAANMSAAVMTTRDEERMVLDASAVSASSPEWSRGSAAHRSGRDSDASRRGSGARRARR